MQGPDMGKCRSGASRKVPPPYSRKVTPPKPQVKAKSSLSGRNYFITMHHQAGVNFENFTEVKFRDILLIGTQWHAEGGRTGRRPRASKTRGIQREKLQKFKCWN